MSSCVISGSPDPKIQFYGYYFLSLMRQLILALPYGDDRVRFNLLIEDNKTANTYPSSLPFAHNLSRTELLQYLYSSHVKPITVESNCRGPLLSLDRLINELHAFKPRNITKRTHLALLTFDNQVDITLSNSSLRKLQQMSRSSLMYLLALTHGPAQNKLLTQNLRSLLNPNQVTFLLPHLTVETTCGTCHVAFDDPQLRMHREELFEAVCAAGGIEILDPIPPPVFSFSISQEYRVLGVPLSVSCTTDYLPEDLGVGISALTICLSNASQLSKLSGKRATLQQLNNACLQMIVSKTEFLNHISDEVSFYVNTLMNLNETLKEMMLLCFRHLGEHGSKSSDAINYTVSNVTILEPRIEKPILKPISWPTLENRAAQFECSFGGFAPQLEVLLVMAPRKPTNQTKIPVLTRTKVHPTRLNRLNWYEIPRNMQGNQFFCIVWQPNETESAKRWLPGLPPTSDLLKISQPIELPALSPDCPVKPDLYTTPTLDSKFIRKGDHVEMNCTAPSTSKNLPLKLVYTTSYLTYVVCNLGHPEGQQSVIPCLFVAATDKSCNQITNVSADPQFYDISCSVTVNSVDQMRYLWIHLVITQLRLDDVNARVFCETIALQADENDVTVRSPSKVENLIFTIPPSIELFRYDAETRTWECVAIAIPPIVSGYIRLVLSDTPHIAYALKKYTSVSRQSSKNIQQKDVLPENTSDFVNVVNFQSVITFRPKWSTPKVLPPGNVLVECKFGGLTRKLQTRITTFDDPSREAEAAYVHLCAVRGPEIKQLGRVSFHRVISYLWFDYDSTLLIVSVFNWTGSTSNPGVFTIREEKLHGLWTVGQWPRIQVSLKEESMQLLLAIEMVNNTEFDTGEYYCGIITTNGKYLYNKPHSSLFLGEQKNVVFARRRLLKKSLWLNSTILADAGEVIQSRCVAWTTNPVNRQLVRFGFSSDLQQKLSNETVRLFTKQRRIVTHVAEQFYESALSDQTPARECHATDQYAKLTKRLPEPLFK
ncbi:hypothetical protein CRM22_000093 [Opisthorchis felineus]|uniref:Ig-like domain-containing protein n=1 Tax=Opisthorchis felineus TaxID=147828 RepID=A0A4S2MH15_OPIFE|nr:hypothetical protein CRM22_000093 [Opisthorchis felineus]